MRLLDLFCGAGGAAKGYADAGFEVVGVDHRPQPHYPFEFIQLNALTAMDMLSGGARITRTLGRPGYQWDEFAAIHASPPCQAYSMATPHNRRGLHPDLLADTRTRLEEAAIPWVIENVPGAPMRADIILCGCMVGLELRRQRWFETSWEHFELRPPCLHEGPVVSVVGHGTPTWVREKLGFNPTIKDYRAAMGIDWMNREELSQAIPPAYTRYIGERLMEHLLLARTTS